MRRFAKIFDTKAFGQLLVINDQDEHGDPCVKVSFDADDYGLGICDMKLSSEKVDACDKMFDDLDQEKAESIAVKLRAQFDDMFS